MVTYNCASNVFNVTYYIWMGLVIAVLCAAVLYRHLSSRYDLGSIDYREMMFKLQKWRNLLMLLEQDTDDKMKLRSLMQYNVVNEVVRRASCHATLYLLLGVQLVGPVYELQRSSYDISSDENKRQIITRRYQERTTMRG
jgi:hypothetical protein